jgi:hypothetical protein
LKIYKIFNAKNKWNEPNRNDWEDRKAVNVVGRREDEGMNWLAEVGNGMVDSLSSAKSPCD